MKATDPRWISEVLGGWKLAQTIEEFVAYLHERNDLPRPPWTETGLPRV